jgi:hypothetical protein
MFETTKRKGRGGSMKKNPCKRRGIRCRLRSITNGMHRSKDDMVEMHPSGSNQVLGRGDGKEDMRNLLLLQYREKFLGPGASRKNVAGNDVSESTKHSSDTHVGLINDLRRGCGLNRLK